MAASGARRSLEPPSPGGKNNGFGIFSGFGAFFYGYVFLFMVVGLFVVLGFGFWE